MNYIILDLEWDSAFYPKQKRFINQILQIGAVKLDEDFNIVSVFEETVKSSISKRVSGRFSRLTGITTEMMLSGIPFDSAVDKYNAWAGTDTVTMTWSDSDLYSIRDNEENLLSSGRRFNIEKYLDLQKFVQGEMRRNGYEDKNQISLSLAAEILGIETEGIDFHTAKDDSLVSRALLKKCYNKERFEALIRDTANPEFYKRLFFKPYSIADLKDERINKKDLVFFCDECGEKAKKTSSFKYRNRWFVAKFECPQCHRKFSGRITFKQTYDDLIVKKKICEIKVKEPENEVQPVPETV